MVDGTDVLNTLHKSAHTNGSGVLAEFAEIAFEMMNWDQELLKAKNSVLFPDKAEAANTRALFCRHTHK